jgi:hypothetical protein
MSSRCVRPATIVSVACTWWEQVCCIVICAGPHLSTVNYERTQTLLKRRLLLKRAATQRETGCLSKPLRLQAMTTLLQVADERSMSRRGISHTSHVHTPNAPLGVPYTS